MQFTNYDLRITIFYESFIQEITKWNRGILTIFEPGIHSGRWWL